MCLAEAIVSGDALVPAISAASILAKVTRDRMLEDLHAQFPEYGFDRHKGYGTAQHLKALQDHGPLGGSPALVCACGPRMGGSLRGAWHERSHTHHFARQPVAEALAGAGAGQRGLPQARARSGWREIICAGPCWRASFGPAIALFAESAWATADPALKHAAPKVHTVPDALMAGISGLESPAGMGFVWDLPADAGAEARCAHGGAGSLAGRRQCGLHFAQRCGHGLRPGAGDQGHGCAVVTQGVCVLEWVPTSACAWSRAWRQKR